MLFALMLVFFIGKKDECFFGFAFPLPILDMFIRVECDWKKLASIREKERK